MGSNLSKQQKNHCSCHCADKIPEHRSFAAQEVSIQTDYVRIVSPEELTTKTVQTEAVSIQPGEPPLEPQEKTTADINSIYSYITSVTGDITLMVRDEDRPFSPMSPDSGCVTSTPIPPHAAIELMAASEAPEAPVPKRRQRRLPELLKPNLEAAKFECCLWVPVEDVARVFANSKDRRMESIARACNCQFVLTDTHRLTNMLGVQQLVCILSNTQADLIKCRNMVDDKFPTFYIKSTEIVERPQLC